MSDKLGSYEFAFYATGSMILISGAVQFLLLCFKPTVETKQTQRQLVSMEDSQKLGETNLESTLGSNHVQSASVQNLQIITSL